MHSPNIPLVVSSFKLSSVYTSSWFLYGENEFNLILLQIDIQFCWISHLSVTEFFWHFWRLCSGPLVSGQHQTACHCSSEVQSEQKHCCMSSCVLSSYNFFACSGLFGFSGLVKEDVRTPRAITLTICTSFGWWGRAHRIKSTSPWNATPEGLWCPCSVPWSIRGAVFPHFD